MVAWYTYPLMWYSSREDMCMLTAEQCAYKSVWYRNWYIADLVYALGTVYLFLVVIAACAAGFAVVRFSPASVRATPSWRKLVAVFRFSTYRSYEIKALRSTTPTIGVMALIGLGFVFFTVFTLAPQPYYWPTDASYGESPPLGTRTGWMALGATPFLIILAAKANMIATLTGVSHEKLIVFHTWVGWAVFVLALIHTFPFIVYSISQGVMVESWNTSWSYWTGVAAIIPQAYLTFMSVPWIRNKFYEFFKATHYFMAIFFMVFFFLHCGFTLTSADYFVVALVLYGVSWCYSQMKTYFDHGIRLRATLTPMSDRCLRIDIPVHALTMWKPGQHMFLRFLTLGVHAFTAHPFTISSLPESDKLIGEKHSVMTFYIRPLGGFTGRLAAAAAKNPGGVSVPVLLEGPYGGPKGRPLTDYDRALVVACGSGAGFSLPFVMQWIAAESKRITSGGEGEKTPSPKKMTVVIATRDSQTLEWYEAAIVDYAEANRLDLSKVDLEILMHFTSDAEEAGAATRDKSAADDEVSQVKPESAMNTRSLTGRPDVSDIIRRVTLEENASVGIAVCGPSGVLEAARLEAAAAELRILRSGPGAKEVYLYSEVFGW